MFKIYFILIILEFYIVDSSFNCINFLIMNMTIIFESKYEKL